MHVEDGVGREEEDVATGVEALVDNRVVDWARHWSVDHTAALTFGSPSGLGMTPLLEAPSHSAPIPRKNQTEHWDCEGSSDSGRRCRLSGGGHARLGRSVALSVPSSLVAGGRRI